MQELYQAVRAGDHAKVKALVDADPKLAIFAASDIRNFFAFSGHKLFAPTGVGVLYGKAAL